MVGSKQACLVALVVNSVATLLPLFSKTPSENVEHLETTSVGLTTVPSSHSNSSTTLAERPTLCSLVADASTMSDWDSGACSGYTSFTTSMAAATRIADGRLYIAHVVGPDPDTLYVYVKITDGNGTSDAGDRAVLFFDLDHDHMLTASDRGISFRRNVTSEQVDASGGSDPLNPHGLGISVASTEAGSCTQTTKICIDQVYASDAGTWELEAKLVPSDFGLVGPEFVGTVGLTVAVRDEGSGQQSFWPDGSTQLMAWVGGTPTAALASDPTTWPHVRLEHPKILVSPVNFNFMIVKVGVETGPITFTVSNVGSVGSTLRYTLPDLAGSQFRYNTTSVGGTPPPQTPPVEVLLVAGGSHTYEIYFQPTSVGLSNLVVDVISDAVDYPSQSLTLAGQGALPVLVITEPSTPPLDLGKVTIGGSPETKSILLLNDGAVDLHITNVSHTNGVDFSVATANLIITPGNTGTIPVTCTPTVPNVVAQTSISFVSDDAMPPHTVTVQAICTGVFREVVLALDISPSMLLYDPQGQLESNRDLTRLHRMEEGANMFLGDLVTGAPTNAVKMDVFLFPDPTMGGNTAQSLLGGLVGLTTSVESSVANTLQNLVIPGPGGTPLWAGLDQARLRLGPDNNGFRALILFSDGYNTTGSKPATIENDVLGTAASVYTVGYGYDGILEGYTTALSVDKPTLGAIATYSDPDGTFINIDATDFDGLLKDTFDEIYQQILGFTISADPEDTITAGERHTHTVLVDEYSHQLLFKLYWKTPRRRLLELALAGPASPQGDSLETCLCQIINRVLAPTDPNVDFREGDTYQVFTVKGPLVRPGEWRLHVSATDTNAQNEPYSFSLIADSGLKMYPTFNRSSYRTGERMELRAVLQADGVPVHGAAVTVDVRSPAGSLTNWLANNFVSSTVLSLAPTEILGEPATPLARRAYAIGNLVGVSPPTATTQERIVLFDDGTSGGDAAPDDGVYSGFFAATQNPGNYSFKFRARGETPAGLPFLRENEIDRVVTVSVAADRFTFDSRWGQERIDAEVVGSVEFIIAGTDEFENHVIGDAFIDDVEITVENGRPHGPFVNNYDGTYTQKILINDTAIAPTITVAYRDTTVLEDFEAPTLTALTFADTAVSFEEGLEASPGANRFDNPQAAVTPPRENEPQRNFTSLGGGGSLTIGISGRVFYDGPGTDLTILEVATDVNVPETTESYRVEIRTDSGYVLLAEVPGGTANLDLAVKNIREASAVRITDTSNRINGNRGQRLSSPGADIEAVGARYVGKRSGWKLDSPYGFSLHAGASLPHGSLTDKADPGFAIVADLEASLTKSVALEGLLGWYRFGGNLQESDLNIYHALGGLRIYALSGPTRVFFAGGAGAYVSDGGSTDLGVYGTGGVQLNLWSRVAWEAGYTLNSVFTTGMNTIFSAAALGARVRF